MNGILPAPHILATLAWLMTHGYLPASATLTQVNFGREIASTDGQPDDFTITNHWLLTQRS